MATKHKTLNYDQRHTAHKEIINALARGDLVRQPCACCGETKGQPHHEDYSKPYDIVWLCIRHHMALHHGREDNPRRQEAYAMVNKIRNISRTN